MAELHPCKIPFSLLLLSLLQFSLVSADDYTPPDEYFINCGSDSTTTVTGRTFTGDVNSKSVSFPSGKSTAVKDSNPPTDTLSLYQTARVFTDPSPYEFQIPQNGTYMVRLHFYPFSSPQNLSNSLFSVSASGFSLLSNFTAQISRNLPIIEEFLVSINVGKFTIFFTPSGKSAFAFVNAIEVFNLPKSFVSDFATHVTPLGSEKNSYDGLPDKALHKIHRINVGGLTVTPENDTLWRTWVPDDQYLFANETAKNSNFYSGTPNYQSGGSSRYIAPDPVYQTAKELNLVPNRVTDINITWNFDVSKNSRHLVRAHFCDIISDSFSLQGFNLYIYTEFSERVVPEDRITRLAAPFYIDYVVDSDGSGLLNISIGTPHDSSNRTAFLNGLEILELKEEPFTGHVENESSKKRLVMIIGLVVGGLAFVFIITMVVFLCMRRRKSKPVENTHWTAVPLYSGITEIFSSRSPGQNLSLGLRIPFPEILYATKNFDPQHMIGEGGFGKVYSGTLRSGVKVAVKRSEPGHNQGLLEFQTEILVLSKIRHRHLVSLIGYCDEQSEMILVYEFMEKGTLRDHLYTSDEGSEKSSLGFVLSWNKRLEICIGAASGLHYLHTCLEGGIIHRDVKSTNILLDEHHVAKVADFGLSRLGGPPDQTHISTEVKGSFGYLDPEYFRFLQLTQKSDVYSFGVVLLEILCARPAINTLLPHEQVNLAEWGIFWQSKGKIENIVDPLIVGKMNSNSLRKFGEIVEKCLKDSGVDRPSMHDVVWDLEYALQLQQTVRLREPHEDSTTNASWNLPMPVVQRLPSNSLSMDDYDDTAVLRNDYSGTSLTSASQVFSQLNIDGAR